MRCTLCVCAAELPRPSASLPGRRSARGAGRKGRLALVDICRTRTHTHRAGALVELRPTAGYLTRCNTRASSLADLVFVARSPCAQPCTACASASLCTYLQPALCAVYQVAAKVFQKMFIDLLEGTTRVLTTSSSAHAKHEEASDRLSRPTSPTTTLASHVSSATSRLIRVSSTASRQPRLV